MQPVPEELSRQPTHTVVVVCMPVIGDQWVQALFDIKMWISHVLKCQSVLTADSVPSFVRVRLYRDEADGDRQAFVCVHDRKRNRRCCLVCVGIFSSRRWPFSVFPFAHFSPPSTFASVLRFRMTFVRFENDKYSGDVHHTLCGKKSHSHLQRSQPK